MDITKEIAIKNKEYIESIFKSTKLDYTIQNFIDILDGISMNVFHSIVMDSYIFKNFRNSPGIDASIKTLQGIKELCFINDFADVYVLIRKLRDNLFLDLFMFQAARTYEKTDEKGFLDLDLSNPDSLVSSIEHFSKICQEKELNSNELISMDNWKRDKLLKTKEKGIGKEYFKFTQYREYIANNNFRFRDCYKKYLRDDFDKLGIELNDYAHSNGISTLYTNRKIEDEFKLIKKSLDDLLELFLVTLFFVDSKLFVASTYSDYAEEGLKPPENSQYWVMVCVYEIFENIKINKEKLYNYLLDNNEFSMMIN